MPIQNGAAADRDIFLAALDLPEEQRDAFLQKACSGSLELQARLTKMLQNAQLDGSFMAKPGFELPPTIGAPEVESNGKMIGPYKLLEQIGEGGMGVVYMAEQKKPVRRLVALKIVKPGMDSRQVIARFDAERQALARMEHPNISRIVDAGTTELGRPYFVMELVHGIPINEFCDQKRFTLRERLELFIPVCQAIQHAHQKGIIHRDLKPSNVLVTMLDVRAVPKVIDFGIAKAFGPQVSDHTQVTGFAQFVGTPLYMSPEQAEMNQLGVDTRSDVYSLGVMLYELLTGTTPFDKEKLKKTNFDEIRRMLREEEPPRPSARISTLDARVLSTVSERRNLDPRRMATLVRGELDWIVMKALDKDRERRYESANALAADLGRYLSGAAVQACPPTFSYRWKKLARRHKSILATGLIVACAVFVGATVSILQAVRASHAEQVAESRLESERGALFAEREARTDAEQAKKLAEESAEVAYRQQYRAETQLGLADLNAGNVSRLYKSLIAHLPEPNRTDRRGWEWFYLLSRCEVGQTLCEHNSQVTALAWSPDGRYLATTSLDGDAIVWDARSGQRVRRFSMGGTLKRGVAWSPDSQRLAWGSAADESAVRIWDRRTDEVRVLRGHEHSLVSCSWSPDGERLSTTCMDKTARIWDTQSWKCLHVLHGHYYHVNASCWTDGSKTLVTAGDGGVKVWDATSGEISRELHAETTFQSASMSSTLPQQLVLGTNNGGQCWLIDTETWQTTHQISSHAGPVNAVAFSPSGTTFASAGADGTAIIWDAVEGLQLSVLRGSQGGVTSLAWNPNGNQLAAGHVDGSIKLWQIPIVREPMTIQSFSEPIKSINWSKHDDLITSVGKSMRTIWDRTTGSVLNTVTTLADTQDAVSADGRLRAVATASKKTIKIRIDNIGHGEMAWESSFNGLYLPHVVWAPDSRRLAAWDSSFLVVFDAAKGQPLFSWSGPAINAASWAPDSTRLAIAGGGDSTDNGNQAWQGYLHVFDIERKFRILKVRLGSTRELATSVAWNPKGDLFAAGNVSGLVGVWNAETGVQLTLAQPHVAAVNELDWTPNGGRIASVSEDGSLKVCDPMTGDELLSLGDDKQPLTAVKWSSDGTRLASGNNRGQIQVWDASSGFEIASSPNHHRSLARIRKRRAQQRFESKDLTGALLEIFKAIELAPSRTSYRRFLADIHARQGKFEEALADLTAAVDLDSEDIHVLIARVTLYAKLGRWTEALADASKLVELKQGSFYRYQQAVIHLKLGQGEAYKEVCKKTIAGYTVEARDGVQAIVWTCVLLPEAVDQVELERLLQLVPESKERVQGSLGALHYRAGHHKEAVDSFIEDSRDWEQSGSIVAPSSPSDALPGYTWYFLAMACHKLGHFAESRTWYDKAEEYTQTILARSAVIFQTGSISWHQRAVLEMLQRETRSVIGVTEPIGKGP